jgi:hypothetical protein
MISSFMGAIHVATNNTIQKCAMDSTIYWVLDS